MNLKKLNKKRVNPENLRPTKKLQFRRNRKLAYSTVGTPDYIAPEVF